MHRPISSSQLRAKYLEFFARQGHAVIPSASLVPAYDPTVLFTTAGMHPLVPHLLGEPHPAGRRLTGVQRCLRTGDIDEVGDDTHLTFFEMLGNWSLGDYFREEAIAWSFEFLTSDRWLGLPLERLAFTCFAGDGRAPADVESEAIWRRLGVPPGRIVRLEDNWWGPAGRSGPCGPDTEMFYWVGSDPPPTRMDPGDARWVEIWNDVFMGYTQGPGGEIGALPRPNVDTGMGLERTLVALNGHDSVYQVDTVRPLHDRLRALTPGGVADAERERQLRVLTDHLRAACFLIADGVEPSNKDRGYVLRRLLRRCIVVGRQAHLPDGWMMDSVGEVARTVAGSYLDLDSGQARVAATIADEAARFERTLAQGLRVLGRRPRLDGAAAFDLFQTYGFPFELTRELARAGGKSVDEAGFRAELERHRARSRTTSAGSFEGGLADHSAEIIRYHTLTHLLQSALRQVLGDQVLQRGSNLTRERLRFDFSHDRKVTAEEIGRVQALVNGWLERPLRIERAVMSEPEARALGAIGAFGEKYGETVSVYTVTDTTSGQVLSREFCGGPHLTSTEGLAGRFHIVREEAVSAGIRRIKAVID
jgi:alanyl-tRNA synthetase